MIELVSEFLFVSVWMVVGLVVGLVVSVYL